MVGVRNEGVGSAPPAKRVKVNEPEAGMRMSWVALLQLPLKKRLSIFDALPEKERILLLYPQKPTWELPERNQLPPNWEELVRTAHTAVTKKIEDRNRIEESSDSDDSSDGEENMIYEKHVLRQMQGGTLTKTAREVHQHRFLAMIERTLPITGYGFHVNQDGAKDGKYCFCPCSRGGVAVRGQALCGMTGLLSDDICNRKGPRFPKSTANFISHVKHKRNSCEYHRILDEFLNELYSDYDGKCGGGWK